MEVPADEASIPTENERNGGRMSVRRKFANLLEYFYNPFSSKPPPPQNEDILARKKPRLEASLPAIAADADDSLNVSKDDAIVAVASPGTGTDPVAASPMQPNVGATRAPHRLWKPEEDAKLTNAVKTTCKKMKFSYEYRKDRVAVAALIPGRTKQQCESRWNNLLSCKGDETTARVGKWATEEVAKLKDAVEKHMEKIGLLNSEKKETFICGSFLLECGFGRRSFV
jgi:hypothetical protein